MSVSGDGFLPTSAPHHHHQHHHHHCRCHGSQYWRPGIIPPSVVLHTKCIITTTYVLLFTEQNTDIVLGMCSSSTYTGIAHMRPEAVALLHEGCNCLMHACRLLQCVNNMATFTDWQTAAEKMNEEKHAYILHYADSLCR